MSILSNNGFANTQGEYLWILQPSHSRSQAFQNASEVSSASPNVQKTFQNVDWRKKGKAKIKMELQSTGENYFSNVFKYPWVDVQRPSCILFCSLGLPLLTLRSNWHFCQQFIKSLLSATPLPPHLQASRDLGLTRLLWRGCYWLSVLAASPPFFQLCFETQPKFKKRKN